MENFSISRFSSPSICPPSFKNAFRFWLKLGFINFGGPAAQIAIMHQELVEKKKWIDETRFLYALNYCMLLPGPEAQQLSIYIGWLLHGIPGGLCAGTLFVLPAVFVLWGLSYAYAAFGHIFWVAGFFAGLKPAALAIVICACLRLSKSLSKKATPQKATWLLAALSFIGLFFLHIPFPLIIACAAGLGFIDAWKSLGLFSSGLKANALDESSNKLSEIHSPLKINYGKNYTWKILSVGLMLWFSPFLALYLWKDAAAILRPLGIFFGKAALVTFGGAYAVLPYVAQQAVEHYAWLNADQMLTGLGLAETTPGPLIMVVQFVGFMAAWNHPGDLPAWLAGSLGAFLTTWVTFVPSFLYIFLGAPYVEKLRQNKNLSSALTAITAAVVGVIFNLSIWFGWHTLFVNGHADYFALCLSITAFLAIWKWKWNIIPVVMCCGVIGMLRSIL